MKSGSFYLTKTGYKSYYNKVSSTSEFDNPTHHLPGIGFKLTVDNNFDIDNKRLTNVADPGDHKDAVNKEYVDGSLTRNTTNLLTSIDTILNSKIPFDADGSLDMQNKRIKAISWPQEDNDAISRTYLHTNFTSKPYVDSILTLRTHTVNFVLPFQNSISNLILFELSNLKLFLLTGKVYIPQDLTLEANVVAHFPSLTINFPIFDETSYFNNVVFPDFRLEFARTLYRFKLPFVIDTNKNLIVYKVPNPRNFNKSLEKGWYMYFHKIIYAQ